MRTSALLVWCGLILPLVVGPDDRLLAQPSVSYRYSAPPNLHDGLQTGSLGAVGIDTTRIVDGTQAILAGRYPGIRSLLILRHNTLVYEHYFADQATIPEDQSTLRDVLQDLRSVTKTVVGLAVLMAHAQGSIPNLDQAVFDFFPEYARHAVDGEAPITLRHLLSMTAGLEWNEEISYLDAANSERVMQGAPDAIEYVLSRPRIAKPGTRFAYCGGCSHLLAEVVRRTTGMPVDAFTAKTLFAPLGITQFSWATDRNEQPLGFSGLRLRSRDLAKLGLLLMNNGRWNNLELVPSALVADAMAEHIRVTPPTTSDEIVGYGYQLWRFSFDENGRREQLVQMSGNGGQAVYLSAGDDMVFVITAGNFDRTVTGSSFDFFIDHVFPAVRDRR